MAASGANAYEEGVQRSGRFCRCPCRLHQHGARVTSANLADAPVMSHARKTNRPLPPDKCCRLEP
jgi:hypothetical protein